MRDSRDIYLTATSAVIKERLLHYTDKWIGAFGPECKLVLLSFSIVISDIPGKSLIQRTQRP